MSESTLLCQHLMCILLVKFAIQLPTNSLGEAAEDGRCVLVPSALVGDSNEAPST